jgi:homocysteine S-methyltransferase
MAKYRQDLPQRHGGDFLTDGGMLTTLIFHESISLPYLAGFVLLKSKSGREKLMKYYEPYLAIAHHHRVGFVLSSPTWRASPDWAAKLGYDSAALDAINKDSIALLETLREMWEVTCEPSHLPCVINGSIGPRGDGYEAGHMNAGEAEAYHSEQIASFVDSGADMVTAFTLTNICEAVGIARAAKRRKMPCAISFTVETDGRLVNGETLRRAIETVDQETNGAPEYFMVNCAHPTHFERALDGNATWTKRIYGIRANASTRSHAELNGSKTLDAGDPKDLGRRYRRLRTAFPAMRILGGCCGTDHRHLTAIAAECLPVNAD